MSAALAEMQAPPSNLDRLTSPFPCADDLRARAKFWRQYAFRESARIGSDQSRRILSNCEAMESLAREMDDPSPVASLVAKQPRPRKVSIAGKIDAPSFWDMHRTAVRAIATEHGAAWYCDAPHATVEVTVPARLRSYVGPLGGRITWRRDWRMPAPRYWPGGTLPPGVEATPSAPRYTGPMGDDHPSVVMIRLAVAEQMVRDRLLREDARADWAKPSTPPVLTKSEQSKELYRVNMEERLYAKRS